MISFAPSTRVPEGEEWADNLCADPSAPCSGPFPSSTSLESAVTNRNRLKIIIAIKQSSNQRERRYCLSGLVDPDRNMFRMKMASLVKFQNIDQGQSICEHASGCPTAASFICYPTGLQRDRILRIYFLLPTVLKCIAFFEQKHILWVMKYDSEDTGGSSVFPGAHPSSISKRKKTVQVIGL
jgi:hypothetical protein